MSTWLLLATTCVVLAKVSSLPDELRTESLWTLPVEDGDVVSKLDAVKETRVLRGLGMTPEEYLTHIQPDPTLPFVRIDFGTRDSPVRVRMHINMRIYVYACVCVHSTQVCLLGWRGLHKGRRKYVWNGPRRWYVWQ